MTEKIDILLYGLGAIGSFYAFILSRSPQVHLTVVARSNYEAVKKDGFTINSDHHGSHTIIPHNVIRNPSEATGTFTYIVLANKAIDQDAIPAQLAPVVDPTKTTLIIIQNGVGNELPYQAAFQSCTILTCVIWVRCFQTAPGVTKHTQWENTQLGLIPNATLPPSLEDARLTAFVRLLRAGHTPVDVIPDIQIARWEKVVWNMAWNSFTTLTGQNIQAFLRSTPDAVPLTTRLMGEAVQIARAVGVELEDGLAEKLIARVRGMPPLGTSMWTDSLEGRQMEVEAILGNAVRMAREREVDCPVLETLYVLLGGVNFRMRKGQAEKE